LRLQVNKEKYIQKEHAKIAKEIRRGREWMGGDVAGSYMQSTAPKSAPFFEDETLWKRELLKYDQNRTAEPLIKMEQMRTIDLMLLRQRMDEVEQPIILSMLQ
jgi:hypothetical protein